MASRTSKAVKKQDDREERDKLLVGVQYLRAHLEKPKLKSKDADELSEDEGADAEQFKDRDEASAALTAAIKNAGRPYEGRVLILDAETTADTRQELRFGTYEIRGLPKAERVHSFTRYERKGRTRQAQKQFRNALDRLQRRGVFYNPDPEIVPIEEQTRIKSYAKRLGFECRTASSFVKDVFYKLAEDYDELLVMGHNLPFDLSRLATWWTDGARRYFGGFSFKLCDCEVSGTGKAFCGFHAPLRIKKIGRGKHLMGLGATSNPETKKKRSYSHVHFLDTQTLGRALLGPGGSSLEGLGKRAQAKTIKREWKGAHGAPVSIRYLSYNRKDVRDTWSLYIALRDFYAMHGVSRQIWSIFSEASLGKAYLSDLGFEPFQDRHPKFPKDVIAIAMEAYYGGRTEVMIRLSRWK